MADPERLVQKLVSRPPTLGCSRLLAIDGPAGSGKSTLAGQVSRAFAEAGAQVETLSLDDMYDGWSGLTAELGDRVVAQVLAPLAAGSPARWQAYDWAAQRFRDWHELTLPDVLVIEGCGAGARPLVPYITLLVWLETTPQAGLERMVERDGTDVLEHLAAWRSSEAAHYAANRTRERADLVIVT